MDSESFENAGVRSGEPPAPVPEKIILVGLCGAVFFSPVSISISTACAYLAFAAALFSGRLIRQRGLWLRSEWFPPVLAFVVLTWVGLAYSQDTGLGLKFAGKTHYWLLAFAAVPLAARRGYARAVALSFVLGIALTSVMYLLQYFGAIPYIEDNRATFIKHITYSLLLVFGLLLLAYLFSERSETKAKLPYAFLTLLVFFTLLFAEGRAGYLAFALLSPFMLYTLLGRKRLVKALLVCAVAVVLMFFSPMVRERVAVGFDDIAAYEAGNMKTSMGQRFHMWEGALKIFMEHPLIGAGTGSYRKLMKQYDEPSLKGMEFNQPHNAFLYMVSGYGVLGLGVFIWLLAALLRSGWRRRHTLPGYALLSFVLVMIVGSLTDTQIIQSHSALLLAVFVGLGGTAANGAGHDGEVDGATPEASDNACSPLLVS